MAKHHRKLRFRTSLAWLVVWTMLLALFPSLPVRTDAATTVAPFTLSQSTFPVGYAGTTVMVTGSDSFPFKQGTKVSLYNQSGLDMTAVGDLTIVDSTHLTFTLEPGVPEGTYNLYVMSYGAASVPLNIVSSFDPTNVRVTPGVNRDIRFDWNDASGSNTQQLIIKYGLLTDQTFSNTATALISAQTFTLTGLQNKTAYRFQISTKMPDGSLTPGVILDNGGQGYMAVDSTPPGDVTDIHVTAVQNGFQVNWTDPTDTDLNLINVQVAVHGTTQWSSGVVVQKGAQQALISPLNTSKRYDLRFTISDIYGNYAYQIDDHNGYGYTSDTTPPDPLYNVSVAPSSDTSASLSWTDPDATNNPDFHHVNIYLSSNLTDWKLITHVSKGVQAATLTGLAPNINYNLKVTTVDDKGNENFDGGYTTSFTTGDSTDVTGLLDMTVAQEPQGGLQLTWDNTVITSVDFSTFKLYYAPINSTDPTDFQVTNPTGKTATSAYLRDMPRGLYKLEMRLYDSHGIEQVIGSDFTNTGGVGYYVSGNGGLNGPSEVGNVRIQSTDSQNMQITWDAATTDGTSVEVFYAPLSSGSWTLAGKVDKNTQSYTVTGLQTTINYQFKLVVVDDTQYAQSAGVVYDNNGFGYSVLGGNSHPPGEVQNATASVSLNTIQVSYTEPTDENFDSVNIYAERQDTLEVVSTTTANKGDGGATITGLLPNIPYVLRITTVDTYGDESTGILLTNNGQGYVLTGNSVSSPNEVQNALLVPSSTQMVVRFQDPQMTDYNYAQVSIKRAGDASYDLTQTVYNGQNETTFYNLQPNQQYEVHISTVSTSGTISPGIDLGGTTGVGLQPISDPAGAQVTPGNNSLTVTWQSPANTAPTQYEVQIQDTGTTTWSDPLFVSPQTTKAVFHGLQNNQSYRVRICTILNGVSSVGLQPGDWNGFSPRAASIVTNPGVIEQSTGSQTFSILGTNTLFPSSSSQVTLKLYDQNGTDDSSLISGTTMLGQGRIDVTLNGNLAPGVYKLELTDPYDGVQDTTLTVNASAPSSTLATESNTSASSGYSSFTMYLTGSGFTLGSTVLIDGISTVTAAYQDSNHLSFLMPSGLLPGAHTIQVHTGTTTSNAIGFNVYPILALATLTTPSVRSGMYTANLTLTNQDSYSRNTEVLLVIHRNGLYVETKTATYTFAAGETKNVTISFGGGTNTPYASGATTNISVEAYVVDGANLAPLSAPVLLDQDVNL